MSLTQFEAQSLLADIEALITAHVVSTGFTTPMPTPDSLGGYSVTSQEELPDGFEHRWPNGTVATQYRATPQVPTVRYTVRTAEGDYSLLIGAELGGRKTHGMDGRGRIVVFVHRGTGLTNLYPLVEFAETDEPAGDGTPLYAAGILRPDKPRSLATAAELPQLKQVAHLQDAKIRQADEVYRGMHSGPSLRLVVKITDVDTMLAHALWVGRIRGGGRLPRPA